MRFIVGFSRKTHFFARAIRWFTKSEFSHTYVVKECEACQLKEVLEANHYGDTSGPYDLFLEEGAIVLKEFEVEHDIELLNQAWDTIRLHRLHRPYSYMQILGDALVITLQTLIFYFFKKKVSLPNPFNQRKADVCSELVLSWLRRAKIAGFENLRDSTVSPEDLYEIIEKDEQFTLLEVAAEEAE
jgi:hypothetical protein